MARIRDDVVGVFHTPFGVFAAGDEVPDEAGFADMWLAPDPVFVVPSRNASAAEWRSFLTSRGVEFPPEAKRDELRDLYLD